MRKRIALISFLAAVAISACGGHSSPRSVVAGHPCAHDFYMQCALSKPPASLSGAPNSIYGIDFGWGSVSAAQAKVLGAHFAFSYLSTDPSKNWTSGLVASYHVAGISTITGWETWANRAQDGYVAGVADAREAEVQAAAVGNRTRAIEFSVDCQCAPSSVLSYFQGVHHVLGTRDDAYGDYAVILYLYQHHVVGNDNFQTYAWSSGQWLPTSFAPIEQYLNGSAYDNDRALRADFGQFPAPVAPLPVCFHKRESKLACAAAKTRIASDHRAAASSQRAYVARGCPGLVKRAAWFAYHLRRFPRVRRQYRSRALAATRVGEQRLSCRLFVQRSNYFTVAAQVIRGTN